jgi:pilus assembly protein CpaE
MNNPDRPIRVVAICEPGATQQQITTALSSLPDFQLVDVLMTTERLVRELRAAEPDIILIDHQLGETSSLDLIDDLVFQFSDAAIVAILPNEDPLKAQQVMLAGARAFIVQPFTQINLLSTLRRVHELEARRTQGRTPVTATRPDLERPLRTIAVYSPRGGVGTTTIATNLALGLYEETGARVLLMEGKLFFGHMEVMLNLRAQNNLADLIPHANNLDESLIRDVISHHASGLQVLMAPNNLQVSQGIRPDDLYSVFIGVQNLYDYVVIDLGSALNDNTVTLMDTADRILLVTTPDLASLHDISRFVQLSRSLAYAPEKMLILLNRAGIPGGVRPRDIENVLHYQLFAQIPNDEGSVLRSLNRGIPLLLRYPRSPASKAFRQLSKAMMQMGALELAGERPGASPERAQREALMASSRLG